MKSYSREFLVTAFLYRYISISPDKFEQLHNLAEAYYDTVDKDTFRSHCSLDSTALKEFKESELCTY